MTAKKAIIVGGGVAGLSVAVALHRIGWESVVLERASGFAPVGAGMQLSANAVRVFDGLGLGSAIRARATAVERGRVRDGGSGRILFDCSLSERRWGAPYFHIHRCDLIASLVEAAGDVIAVGAPVRRVGQDADGAFVDLEDGTRHSGDIVIGADGARSRIRAVLWGDGYRVANGDTVCRRLVSADVLGRWAPADGMVSIWVGSGVHHVTYRLRGGSLATIVTVMEAGCEAGCEAGGEAGCWSGWHGVIRAMYGVPAEAGGRSELAEVVGLHCWSKGRVVLVGDACHALLPHMAQGAAMAVEDAWVLARVISDCGGGSVVGALSAFRGARVKRVVSARQRSRRNRHLFHVGSRAGRCIAIGAMHVGLPLGSLDWLYCGDVTSGAAE